MTALEGYGLTYDDNGNLTSKVDAAGTTTYTWDARNRLTDISGPSLSASFDYDALGRRISRTVNSTTTSFIYDGWDIIRDTTGGVTTDYTRTLNIDEPLAYSRSNGTVRYYVADALGSITALTDANGIVTTSYQYDAFGNVTITGSDYNAFQYTGRENDGTGLYYYRARYYSPEMRRFVSEDPIRMGGGINFYRYVRNNPTNKIDPLGLGADSVCVEIGKLGAELVELAPELYDTTLKIGERDYIFWQQTGMHQPSQQGSVVDWSKVDWEKYDQGNFHDTLEHMKQLQNCKKKKDKDNKNKKNNNQCK